MQTISVDVESIAVVGNIVRNERVDHIKDAGGQIIVSIKIAGTLTLDDDGKVSRWMEYFDPTETLAVLADKAGRRVGACGPDGSRAAPPAAPWGPYRFAFRFSGEQALFQVVELVAVEGQLKCSSTSRCHRVHKRLRQAQ